MLYFTHDENIMTWNDTRINRQLYILYILITFTYINKIKISYLFK